MAITTILFDLDGTLLPMDQDVFVNSYFKRLAAKLVPYGYEPQQLIEAIWKGTGAMIMNNGACTNEQAFWLVFAKIYGEGCLQHIPVFDDYYHNEFQSVAGDCGYNPRAAQCIAQLKQKGYRLALATNPIFPAVATRKRIRWAGLTPEDFELYTTYENSCHCKPNPAYYEDVVRALGVAPKDCLMVGNDVEEDMIAETMGMKVFLITDCMINKYNKDISVYPHGGFPELAQFLDSLLTE